MGFVTAFRGRRDGYEVPIALVERGLLDAFVTDHFAGPLEHAVARLLPARQAEKLRSRGDARIDPTRVVRLRGTALRESIHAARGLPADDLYQRFDPAYGEAAAALARRHRSDLLMYSAYAAPAFTARYDHDPRKILFQYHPHIGLERRLLTEDLHSPARRVLPATQLHDSGLAPSPARIAADDAWRLADHILCASSFTRRSLVEEGAAPDSISVIPYGVDLPPSYAAAGPAHFHALFVGSGFYRKGLHHLVAAWRKARLPAGSRLTVVARVIEADLLDQVRSCPTIDYLAGVGAADLQKLYATASLFVMPSIVEGFGQVYLEALSHGLPVLGTANTCVPDLGTPDEGLFCTAPGQSDALAGDLEALAVSLAGDSAIRARARAVAERHGWAQFRAGIGRIASGTPD